MNTDNVEEKFGCNDIAQAIKSLMTMANFSGYIRQDDGTLRQFSISTIEGDHDNAVIRFDIAGHGFVLEITPDPNAPAKDE